MAPEHTGGMGSKYDSYWAGRLGELRAAVERAAVGLPAVVELPGLRSVGERRSWSGVAEVCSREVTYSSMAHASSLGRAIVSKAPDISLDLSTRVIGHQTHDLSGHGCTTKVARPIKRVKTGTPQPWGVADVMEPGRRYQVLRQR